MKKIDYTPHDDKAVAYEVRKDGSYVSGTPTTATLAQKKAAMLGKREDYLDPDGEVECYTIIIE